MQRHLAGGTIVFVGVALLSCAPKYPKCAKDEHCRQGELCVNGQCQQCRTDANCPDGQKCKQGRCEAEAACTQDASCGPGMKCEGGKCVKAQCQTDGDCPEDNECQQGRCVAPPKVEPVSQVPCAPATVYFGLDEHVLSPEATTTLRELAPCLKKAALPQVRIEGHCDPRGTEAYNLALGDRRARSVKTYLERLGVTGKKLRVVSKGKLEATGADESGWSRDRKAQFAFDR